MAMPVSIPYSVLHFAMTVSSDGRVRARLEGWVRETNASSPLISPSKRLEVHRDLTCAAVSPPQYKIRKSTEVFAASNEPISQ